MAESYSSIDDGRSKIDIINSSIKLIHKFKKKNKFSDIDKMISVDIKRFIKKSVPNSILNNFIIIDKPTLNIGDTNYKCVTQSFGHICDFLPVLNCLLGDNKHVYIYKIYKRKYIINEFDLSDEDLKNKKFEMTEAYSIRYFTVD
jgi:hypothetical protein